MRRAFLMLFPGLAAAQVMPTKPRVCDANGCREVEVVEKQRPPKNGECPVCGTMAPPITPEVIAYKIIGSAGGGAVFTEPVYEKAHPLIVRCAHCSNAFYQDAEVAK